MKSIRKNIVHLLKDLYDSGVILIFILIYIIMWSIFMSYVFRNSVEGYFYFKDISSSFYSMMILLTTANFPDVMLPAYSVNYFNFFFFWLYLVLGLYVLMNMLLASVYAKFKQRLEKHNIIYLQRYVKSLGAYIDRFDFKDGDHISETEMKVFFSELFRLKINENRKCYETYRELIKEMNP